MDKPYRIYLAGKIGPNDWRTGIVAGLSEWRPEGWVPQPWPVLTRAIFGRFDYVGPFFFPPKDASDDVRFGHQFPMSGLAWNHCGDDEFCRNYIAEECLEAIRQADLFFFWFDSEDCHGSILELGYALALNAAWHKPEVLVVSPHEYEPSQAWFVVAAARGNRYWASDPAEALHYLTPPAEPAFDSPAEEAFWAAWGKVPYAPRLECQHEVLGGRYRIDFAHLPTRTAIEIDGYSYHNDKSRFQRDRKWDRVMEAAGWVTLRFAAVEVFNNGAKCADEVKAAIGRRYDLVRQAAAAKTVSPQ